MQSGTGRRAASAPGRKSCRHHFRVLGVALVASITAACKHDAGPMASAQGAPSATVAFESIDGPPMGIFNKLVQNLNEEADVRQLAVVSREGPAQYRVRGYLAAHVERRQTVIAWVWDVYDANERRALRITGEEPAPGARTAKNAWSAADERLLRRIAQTSLDNLARYLGADTPARAGGTALAFGDDTPEASGIVRSANPESDRASVAATSPQRRATQAARPDTTSAMAFTIE